MIKRIERHRYIAGFSFLACIHCLGIKSPFLVERMRQFVSKHNPCLLSIPEDSRQCQSSQHGAEDDMRRCVYAHSDLTENQTTFKEAISTRLESSQREDSDDEVTHAADGLDPILRLAPSHLVLTLGPKIFGQNATWTKREGGKRRKRFFSRRRILFSPMTTSSDRSTEALLELAKASLEVSYREDGPPLGFDFDPIPFGKRAMVESMPKSRRMILGDYHAEALADGSIHEIRKREEWMHGNKRKIGKFDEEGDVTAMQEGLDPEDVDCDQRNQRQLMKEQERLQRLHKRGVDRQQKEHEKKLKAQRKEEEKRKMQLERDMKKLEREMERERRAEERKKQQEAKKKEKDLQKALAAHVKVAQRAIQKELEAIPPEDLDLEWDILVDDNPSVADRPSFPPIASELSSAFPQLGNKIGGDIVMIWGFVRSFSDIVAVPAFTVKELVEALTIGQKSTLLSSVHIVLIRLIQADMEESHHTVLTQGSGGTSNFMDRAIVGIAGTLDEAVAWGFDVDAWRAHLNLFTWPEILRQLSIAAGYGPKRSRGFRDDKSIDNVEDESSRLGYGLKMPSRLTQGTVKAAAWQVLSEVGPEGLTISEIASRIQRQGLRDLRTSKTPEATVAGALSRDAAFCRVAPATYALHVVLPSHEHQMPSLEAPDASGKIENESGVDASMGEVGIDGEPWIGMLSEGDYDDLSLEMKLEVMKTLCYMALESPTIRACLEARLELESIEHKRQEIEAKAEKRARREQAAEATQRRLMELESVGIGEGEVNLNNTVKTMMTEQLQTQSGTKLDAIHRHHVRFEPLGRDRRYNRYWRLDGQGRDDVGYLFLEINGHFKILNSEDRLDALIACLDPRGMREGPLSSALQSYRRNLKNGFPVWTESIDGPIADGVPDFDVQYLFAKRWSNGYVLNRELRMQVDWLEQLKAHLGNLQAAVGSESKTDFDSISWTSSLDAAGSLDDVVVLMSQLEYSFDAHLFHHSYNRHPVLLRGAWRDQQDLSQRETPDGYLCWLPRSFAAAFYRLLSIDAGLQYRHGTLTGREALLGYKYVQKPFVHELNPHVEPPKECKTSQTMIVSPLHRGGKLTISSFPVLQKSTPSGKQSVPFSFPVDRIREAVTLAEKGGTLYADIQPTKGRRRSKQNGRRLKCLTVKRPNSEMEDEVSTSGAMPSSEEIRDRDDETIERSEMSRDDDSEL